MNNNFEQAVKIILSYEGSDSDNNFIDLYDVSHALIGFQRSIALTTHLIINGEIITQSPSLKGARVLASPAEDGSWKMAATVLAGIYAIGTAPINTPLGHIVHSVYDYVVSESLGVHVDYKKTIGQLFEEQNENKILEINLKQHKIDSLIEKCATPLTDIHRPIFKTKTAITAKITSELLNPNMLDFSTDELSVGPTFSMDTFHYIHEEFTSEKPEIIYGRISSYNSNTFKGRIYVPLEGRPISFELSQKCRSNNTIEMVTTSLAINAQKNGGNIDGKLYCRVFKNTSRSGHLKSYIIVAVSNTILE